MRGAYTSGVLDVLLENNIEFPVVYGISAGACNGLSYVSKQLNRNFDIFYQYIEDERYLSISNLRKTGSLFGFDFIFGELFHTLLPFDYKAFYESPVRFRVGATDLNTGKAVFFDKEDITENMEVVQASSSLPFVSNIVSFKGYEMLDGGIADPIPVEQSIKDGNHLNVLVLTRDDTYRKKSRPEFPRAVLRVKYGDYPNMIETMMNRPEIYNAQTDFCRELERDGKAVIIRPTQPIVTGRYEKNRERLADIYRLGVRDAQEKLSQVRELLARDTVSI